MRGEGEKELASRTQFQAFKSGGDVQTNLALQAQRLQRDRIIGAADQHVAAGADADRGATLRASIIAGEIAGSQAPDGGKHAPGKRGFLGDAEIDADLADGRDVTVFRHAVDAQHAAEIGDRADDEADAGPAAAFEHTNLDAFRLLGARAREGRNQHGGRNAGKGDQTTHGEISEWKELMQMNARIVLRIRVKAARFSMAYLPKRCQISRIVQG